MKTTKKYFKLCLLSNLLCVGLVAQQQVNPVQYNGKTAADYYWATMPSMVYQTLSLEGDVAYSSLPEVPSHVKPEKKDLGTFKLQNTDSGLTETKAEGMDRDIHAEIQKRYLRQWGIQFWKNFPEDPRRFDWLLETIGNPPVYFASISEMKRARLWIDEYGTVQLDTAAKREWNKLFLKFRKEYMSAPEVKPEKKAALLSINIGEGLRTWRKHGIKERFDYTAWVKEIQSLDNWIQINANSTDFRRFLSNLKSECSQVISYRRSLGLSEADVKKYAELLEQTGIKELKPVVDEYRNPSIHTLMKKYPLEFRGKTFEGKSLELKDFKGKLVYVDFWTLGCTGCIAVMPRLKNIYEKYKKYGLEVISACFVEGKREDGSDYFSNEKERIRHVHETLCGDWPIVLLEREPGEKKHRIRENYAFKQNPNLMLFDEKGNLLLFNGGLNINLDDILHDYFKAQGKIKD